jgi:hypothetical protein
MRSSMASLSALLLSACTVVTTGDRGELTFTPSDCGQSFCSLDLSLAAGSSITVDLHDVDGFDLAHVGLIAADSRVAVVVPLPAWPGDSRWQVLAIRGGRTALVALDGSGYEIDRTGLHVEEPSGLGLELVRGPAAAHAIEDVGLEVWTVTAAHPVAFRVRPLDWAGGTLMGRLDLSVDLDSALFDALEPAADLSEGELAMRPMFFGDYAASFYGPDGLFLDVVLEVR